MEFFHNPSNSCLCQRLAEKNGFPLAHVMFNYYFTGVKIYREVLVYIPVNKQYKGYSFLTNALLTAEQPIMLLIPTELIEVIVEIKQRWGRSYNLKCIELTNLLNNDPNLIAITQDLLYISTLIEREHGVDMLRPTTLSKFNSDNLDRKIQIFLRNYFLRIQNDSSHQYMNNTFLSNINQQYPLLNQNNVRELQLQNMQPQQPIYSNNQPQHFLPYTNVFNHQLNVVDKNLFPLQSKLIQPINMLNNPNLQAAISTENIIPFKVNKSISMNTMDTNRSNKMNKNPKIPVGNSGEERKVRNRRAKSSTISDESLNFQDVSLTDLLSYMEINESHKIKNNPNIPVGTSAEKQTFKNLRAITKSNTNSDIFNFQGISMIESINNMDINKSSEKIINPNIPDWNSPQSIKLIKKVEFSTDSEFSRIALIENNSKLLISDYKAGLVHVFDLNGNLLKSVEPNEKLKRPLGIYILDKEIYIGNCDVDEPQIFVYDFEFHLKQKFGDFNLSSPHNLIIDKEYNKNNLYVSDGDNKITIWEAKSGLFIDKIDIEAPMEINFTKQSLFALSGVFFGNVEILNNKVEKIVKGGNCIYEIDKNSLEIKRKIIGEWYSPVGIFKLLPDGNLQTTAYTLDKNRSKSEFRYLLTLDKNGRILSQILLDGIQSISDVAIVDNKIIINAFNTMKIFEFDY
jgi:hypothetical protein